VKRTFIALTACLAAAWIVGGAQAQQYPLPPSTGTVPSQPQTPTQPQPPPPPDLANCTKQTPKMAITVARFDRFRRTTTIVAPISTLASGNAQVQLLGGGRVTEFTVPVNSARGLIRATRGIDAAQARASTAILTLRYLGDADTRPQTLRLRAALRAAKLYSIRPTITPDGRLDAAGAITKPAKGFVRVQLDWVNASDGSIGVVERLATIRSGRWGIRSQLPAGILSQINSRCSTLQATVLFTGYQRLLMRGEMRSFQVAPAPVPAP
jgi:hypothetical protein